MTYTHAKYPDTSYQNTTVSLPAFTISPDCTTILAALPLATYTLSYSILPDPMSSGLSSFITASNLTNLQSGSSKNFIIDT